ncbi:MAG: hypothetical protein ACI4PT_00120 [Candidatus Avoscillospira sp.]
MTHQYDDILHLPHPTSAKHPRMPIGDRAAIFSPFAALTGHSAAIAETARLTEQKIQLDEDGRSELDEKQRMLEEVIARQPEVTVTWFRPDDKKDGGSYVTTTGNLKRTDGVERVMVMRDGTRIPLDDIIELDSQWLPQNTF